MKKYLLLILSFVMFVPFFVNAETCEPDKVTIESIEINDKTDKVIEKTEPKIEGRNLDLDLQMFKVGDSIEYKMIVKNDSNEDYELDKTSLSANSDHIEYSFETKDNSNIVKAGETKEVILTVKYKNEVSDDDFIDGVYKDNEVLQVNLSTGDGSDTTNNPNTGLQSYALVLVALLVLGIIILISTNRKKYIKYIVLVIGALIFIPISVSAICKCDIKVNSNVEIVKNSEFCYTNYNQETRYFEFEFGMTWLDFYDSSYYKEEDWKEVYDDNEYWYYFPNAFYDNNGTRDWLDMNYLERFGQSVPTELLKPKETGCYVDEPV